jgi:hypothetical protein
VNESRTGSSVTLNHVVTRPGPNGTVTVLAEVERTWRVEGAAPAVPPTGRSSSGDTPGQVEPDEATLSIHVFDRCGNMTEIQVPLPAYQDGTDLSDDSTGPAAGGGAGPQEPVKKCEIPPKDGSAYSVMAHASAYYKISKNWEIHAEMCSQWRVPWHEASTGTDYWDSIKHINYMRLYPRDGKWSTKEAKYISNNMEMLSKATACFYNTKYKLEPSGQVTYEVRGTPSASLGLAFSGGRGVECIPYEGALKEPKKPAENDPPRRPTLWNRMPEIEAHCFQDALELCQLNSYQHRMIAEFTFWYHGSGGAVKDVTDRMVLKDRWRKYDGQYDGSH